MSGLSVLRCSQKPSADVNTGRVCSYIRLNKIFLEMNNFRFANYFFLFSLSVVVRSQLHYTKKRQTDPLVESCFTGSWICFSARFFKKYYDTIV